MIYSLKNFHGDTALTINASGVATSSLMANGPFGEGLIAGTLGAFTTGTTNSSNQFMGWAANPARKQETMFTLGIVQMGQRVYIPSLGRFLQADPVEGGTSNAYVYVQDPINFDDYNGMFGVPKWAKWVAVAVAVVAIVAIVIVLAPAAIVGATLAAAGTAITSALGAATLPLLGAIAATGISVAARGKIDLTTAFHAAVGAASGCLLAAGAALVSSIMSKSTDAATTASEVSPTFKSSPTIGMAAHTEFSVQIEGQGGIANKAIFNNSLLRPDGYFANSNTVLELKPGNPNGVIQGLKQLNEYQGLSNGAGELWLYNIDSNGFFNYWRY